MAETPSGGARYLTDAGEGGRNLPMATENEQLSTWLPPDEAQALRELAKRERRSVSQMIRLAVLALLEAEQAAA